MKNLILTAAIIGFSSIGFAQTTSSSASSASAAEVQKV